MGDAATADARHDAIRDRVRRFLGDPDAVIAVGQSGRIGWPYVQMPFTRWRLVAVALAEEGVTLVDVSPITRRPTSVMWSGTAESVRVESRRPKRHPSRIRVADHRV